MDLIKKKDNKWCLNDIVNKIIKSKSPTIYINKITKKDKIDEKYYIDENTAIELIKKGRSK